MVSIVAFQAGDMGSIPVGRIFLVAFSCLAHPILVATKWVDWVGLGEALCGVGCRHCRGTLRWLLKR